MIHLLLLAIFLSTTSCSYTSSSSLQEEARQQLTELIQIFEGISSIEELVQRQHTVELSFTHLVHLLIEIKKYQITHGITWEASDEDLALGDQLRHEMQRILRFDGAKIIIEKCQNTALCKLQQYERTLLR